MSSPSIKTSPRLTPIDSDSLGLRHIGAAVDHQPLDLNRAFDGRDDGGKLQQEAVARRLDDAASSPRHWARRLAMLAHRARRARLVLAHEPRVADDSAARIAARRRAAVIIRAARPCPGHRKWAQAAASGRVVAHRCPASAGAGNGEGRVEGEADLDGGMRLVQSAKLREGGGQLKMWIRTISIGLDRPPEPLGRLLPTTEVQLRHARRASSRYKPAYRAD